MVQWRVDRRSLCYVCPPTPTDQQRHTITARRPPESLQVVFLQDFPAGIQGGNPIWRFSARWLHERLAGCGNDVRNAQESYHLRLFSRARCQGSYAAQRDVLQPSVHDLFSSILSEQLCLLSLARSRSYVHPRALGSRPPQRSS